MERGRLSRSRFLALTAAGGATLVVGGSAAARRGRTDASGPIADLDLALARLAVSAELLGIEFYGRAIASKKLRGAGPAHLKRALFNEQEHLKAMSEILTGAGQTVPTADDFTFTFPKGTFDSPESITTFGDALETVFVQAYLGAVEPVHRARPEADRGEDRRERGTAPERVLGHDDGSSGRRVVPARRHYDQISDELDAYIG